MDYVLPSVYAMCDRKIKEVLRLGYIQRTEEFCRTKFNGITYQSVLRDFEIANINTLRTAFVAIKITACLFHFEQALWRQIVNRRLRKSYLNYNEPPIKHNLLELMGLPFVSLTDLQEIFD